MAAEQQAQPETMAEWYRRYYSVAPHSRAHAYFCERLYGRDLCQHGFADMRQVASLLQVLHLEPDSRVLELGCGTGDIAEHISDGTGARVIGIDNVSEAVAIAHGRALRQAERLIFVLSSVDHLGFSAGTFDAIITLDALYFTDLDSTVAQMGRILKASGEMGILYSHGADRQTPLPVFVRESLPPDKTPLGQALQRQRMGFHTCDLTDDDCRHAQREGQIASGLRAQFEAQGNGFLYDNRYGEVQGVMAAIEANAHGATCTAPSAALIES